MHYCPKMSRALKKCHREKEHWTWELFFFRNVLLKAIFLSGNHEKPLFFRFTKSRYYRCENPKKYDCFTKARFQWKQRIFFYFATWISWLFSLFWWCSRDFIAWNPWVVFIKLGKKNETSRAFALSSDLRSGPRAQPVTREVSFFFSRRFMKPPMVSSNKNAWNH